MLNTCSKAFLLAAAASLLLSACYTPPRHVVTQGWSTIPDDSIRVYVQRPAVNPATVKEDLGLESDAFDPWFASVLKRALEDATGKSVTVEIVEADAFVPTEMMLGDTTATIPVAAESATKTPPPSIRINVAPFTVRTELPYVFSSPSDYSGDEEYEGRYSIQSPGDGSLLAYGDFRYECSYNGTYMPRSECWEAATKYLAGCLLANTPYTHQSTCSGRRTLLGTHEPSDVRFDK